MILVSSYVFRFYLDPCIGLEKLSPAARRTPRAPPTLVLSLLAAEPDRGAELCILATSCLVPGCESTPLPSFGLLWLSMPDSYHIGK